MKKIFVIILLCKTVISFGQNAEQSKITLKKNLEPKFTDTKITIDGKLDEAIWQSTPIAAGFVMFQPDNGKPIPETKKTEVRVLYDNDGVYIGATMYDDEPSKILKEMGSRDEFGAADFFGVFINGFNDGQQDFRFIVSAANVQADCQATDNSGEDYTWDAVWDSKVAITDFGWVVEIKIPYAALRFSPKEKQTWDLNFMREIKRDRQKYTWNPVDTKLGTFTQQAGILDGIKNIKTPTRLFLMPYTSFYLNADAENKTKGSIKGGMDIKYGINDAFTLDAILVPDFGQTALDQQKLNLGPFEQQFDENRAFFTEGTDLFSKGNLFYSRRIGGKPTGNVVLNLNEEILEKPSKVALLNATKISGRTKNGLGIGFLNAVTEKTYAKILDTSTGIIRNELIEPLANFNLLVLDQRFNKNSSVSFINSNVMREGSFRDANVSSLAWDLKNKQNKFGLQGLFNYSHVKNSDAQNGFGTYLEINKLNGNYRYGVGSELYSKNYNPNDLGLKNENNYYTFYGNASYRSLKPTKNFNYKNFSLNVNSEFQRETDKLKNFNLHSNINFTTLKNNTFGFGFDANPLKTYNFADTREANKYVIRPAAVGAFVFLSSNYNKKFALDFETFYMLSTQKDRTYFNVRTTPRYRFSDHFSVNLTVDFTEEKNDQGFAEKISNDIIFGQRNINTISNAVGAKYAVNSKTSFNFRLLHYWSYSENNSYLALQNDGTLTNYSGITQNHNADFSNWNTDLSCTYWFAPGSQLTVLYRNNAGQDSEIINKNLGRNFGGLLNNRVLQHTFSISIKYFIDYNQAKHWM